MSAGLYSSGKSKGRYSVKNVKTFATPDGGGYNCSLYKDGVKIAECHEGGYGGCVEFHFVVKGEERAFYDFVKSFLYYCDYSKKDVEHSPETFLEELINAEREKKALRARCKKYVVVKYKEDEKGSCRLFKVPPTPENIARVKQQYGEKIEFVYNEVIE